MTNQRHSTAIRDKFQRLQQILEAMFEEALRGEFYGVLRVELMIADGTIQRIARSVEQFEK